MVNCKSIIKKDHKFIHNLNSLLEIARQNSIDTGEVLRVYSKFNLNYDPNLEKTALDLTKKYFDYQRDEMSEGYQLEENKEYELLEQD
jgi:hypothetical protein